MPILIPLTILHKVYISISTIYFGFTGYSEPNLVIHSESYYVVYIKDRRSFNSSNGIEGTY